MEIRLSGIAKCLIWEMSVNEDLSVIKFTCKHCDKIIKAPNYYSARKARCPKCGSFVTVPDLLSTTPLNSQASSTSRSTANDISDKEVSQPQNKIRRFFIPCYDETSLFLIAVTFILLYITNSIMRSDVTKLASYKSDIRNVIIILLFAGGLFLSLYHVFTDRQKRYSEKCLMLFFVIIVCAASGIRAGMYMLETSVGWYVFFPIWNIVNGVLLLIMLRFNIIDEKCISDRNSRLAQVGIGLVVLGIVFLCCQYLFKYHWAVTFSICVAYATNVNREVERLFGQN